VPEPAPDSIDVVSGAEKMAGRRMSNGMRAYTFIFHGGHPFLCRQAVAFHEGMNAETGDRDTTTIEEDVFRRRALTHQ